MFSLNSSEWFDSDEDGVGDILMLFHWMEQNGLIPMVMVAEITLMSGQWMQRMLTVISMESEITKMHSQTVPRWV